MKKPYPMVLVVWNDAHCSIGTGEDLEKEHSPKLTYSVGFQIKKDRAGITIAQDCYEDCPDYRMYSYVPSGMIVSITKVLENS